MARQVLKIFAIILFGSIFLFSSNAQAANTDIIITEIGAYEANGYEWVEIFNKGTEPVDLTDWKFWEADTNHGLKLIQGGSMVLESGKYAIITQNDINFLTKYFGLNATIIDSFWSTLNEGGELIGLKDAGGNFIEQFIYVSAPNFSLERKNYEMQDYSINNWMEHPDSNTIGKINYWLQNIPSAPVVNPPSSASQTGTSSGVVQNEILGYEIGSVVINELVSDPADGEVEFVELYNKFTRAIDLTDWRLEEGSKTKNILSYTIPANGFFVLEKPKGILNNTGDIVKLFDPAGGLIDQVVYGDWDDGNKNNNAPRADDPLSLSRRFDGEDSNNDASDFVLTENITKGGSNIIFRKEVAQNDAAQKINTEIGQSSSTEKIVKIAPDENNSASATTSIKISEFLPNPVGSDSMEFVELYNFGDKEVDLAGFKLDDEDGGSSPYIIPESATIKAGEYLVFLNSDTKISLNNTEDAARLLNPKNIIVDEIFYSDVIEGLSYARDDKDEWFWSAPPTPGEKNIIKEVSNKIKTGDKSKIFINTALENLRAASAGDKVKVLGVVAVEPNIFGTQYFYIINDIAGAQIYMHKKDFPDLTAGDEVEITGEISEAYNETRIKVANKEDIKKTGKHLEILPRQIEIADIDESLEGSFALLKGEITELKTSYMYIDDGANEIKVYFKKGAKIQSKDFALGELVEVKGLLGESRSGYQLLPRGMADIQKINDTENGAGEAVGAEINKQKEITEKYLTVTAGGLISILIGLFAKARGAVLLAFTKRIGKIAWAFVKRG